MNQQIADAYSNTKDFVTFIQNNLPEAKINFVSMTWPNKDLHLRYFLWTYLLKAAVMKKGELQKN
jgi:hypothetical protein